MSTSYRFNRMNGDRCKNVGIFFRLFGCIPKVMRNGDVTQQMGDGTPRKYELKDKHCIMKAKAGGLVKLECYFVYNHVRAAVRTFKPREVKMMEKEEKFNRKAREGVLADCHCCPLQHTSQQKFRYLFTH